MHFDAIAFAVECARNRSDILRHYAGTRKPHWQLNQLLLMHTLVLVLWFVTAAVAGSSAIFECDLDAPQGGACPPSSERNDRVSHEGQCLTTVVWF